jgi:hypothetical protein
MAADSANIVKGGATVVIGSDVGAVEGGIRLTPTFDMLYAGDDIEQVIHRIKAWKVNENYQLEFTFSEPQQANIKSAWDNDNTWATGPPATLDFGDNQVDPQEVEISVTGYVSDGLATITLYRCVLSAPAQIQFAKNEYIKMAVTFDCLYDDQTENLIGQWSVASS